MKAKLNIVVLENIPASDRGGQELSLLDICRELSKKGHEIVLLHTEPGDLLEEYRKFCVQIIPVNGYRFEKKNPFGSLFFLVRDLFRAYPKPSVVYANQYFDSFFAGLFSKIYRCRFVCHLRLPPPERFSRQYRFGLSAASALVAVSEKTRSEYVASGFNVDKIRVVPNGIDIERFKPVLNLNALRSDWKIDREAFVVTYAGRHHPVKGVDTLMRAFTRIIQASPQSVLILSGRPAELYGRDYHRELAALAEELGISNQIRWIDHCKDVAGLFALSDIVVLPSLWSEPFGRILIEAMACGTPAVASRVGGIPEILTGEFASFLFEPGDAAQLSSILERLKEWRRNDPDLASRCRRHVAQNFNLEKTVGAMEQIFMETVS